MNYYFKMRSLSSPTSRGGVVVVGPAAVLFCGYFTTLFWDIDLFLLSFFFVLCGLLFFAATIIILFGYMELEVNTEKQTWSEQLNIFNWRLLPKSEAIPDELNYILIFDSLYTYGNANDDIKSDSIDFYEVSVIYNGKRKKVFNLCTNHSEALEIAKKIRSVFNLEIIDKTTGGVQY